MKKQLISMMLMSLLIGGPVFAIEPEWTWREFFEIYDAGKNDQESIDEFNKAFGLIGSGLLSANAMLISQGRRPLYCLPKKLVLTDDQFFSILRSSVGDNPKALRMKIYTAGVFLSDGIARTFPCE